MKFTVWDIEKNEFAKPDFNECFLIDEDGQLVIYNWAQELVPAPTKFTVDFDEEKE